MADYDQYTPDEGEQVIEVEKFVAHPNWHGEGLHNGYLGSYDIALIKVNRLLSSNLNLSLLWSTIAQSRRDINFRGRRHFCIS